LLCFGNISQKVAERLKCFGVTIMAHDPYFGEKEFFDWIEFVSFEKLLKSSDVLSIHAPLNEESII
jgi:phosphoglycerate dehydrogenase-like enzyme